MINRIYKSIHNKYLNFFKLFFFLRYLFVIFLISISLFLTIPKFFNYEKKLKTIKAYLLNHYDLELNNYSLIRYKVFPLPNLSIQKANLKIQEKDISLNTKKLQIFLNLKDIYNNDNFETERVVFLDTQIFLKINKTKEIFNYFNQLKYQFKMENLNLNFKKNDQPLFEIKNISFSNFGYRKNQINGEMFNKPFKILIKNNYKNLNFTLVDSGIKANLILHEKKLQDSILGSSQINVLNNLFKFDFNLKNNELEIIKSNFRNKNLSLSFDGLIKLIPYFKIDSNININKLDYKIFEKIDLENILQEKEIIRKLNGTSKVSYNSKKFRKELIKNYSSEFQLANGRLTFLTKMFILGMEVNCNGESLFTDEYPRLYFDCRFDVQNKKSFLKKLSITNKLEKRPISINVVGSINLFNDRIDFKTIDIDKNSSVKEEDIKYFKETFERVLLNDNFFGIFNKSKIKKFVLEII